MTAPSDDRSPMAMAAAWTSQVTTISAEMALPGLGGHWLDQWLGVSPLFLILGAILGLTTGMWHLMKLAGRSPSHPTDPSDRPDKESGRSR